MDKNLLPGVGGKHFGRDGSHVNLLHLFGQAKKLNIDIVRLTSHNRNRSGDRLETLTLDRLDHHRPSLSEKLIDAQHHASARVLAATHVHLDHNNCLEVVIMKGRSAEVRHLGDQMLSLRGVKHGRLVVTSTGKNLC